MEIDRVTLTGADDSVRPERLAAIADQYPFVEWGILFSPKRQGEPRYPSVGWLNEFLKLRLPCAAHLCGDAVTRFMADDSPASFGSFGRVQLNFNLQTKRWLLPNLSRVVAREEEHGRTVILQMNNNNHALLGVQLHGAAFLFDASGGRGMSPASWPAPLPGRMCGYAGGLGPDMLTEQLGQIADAAGNATIWIDMEGRLRSDGGQTFDADKAERCLALAWAWVVNKSATRG